MANMGTLTVRLDDLYDGAKQDLADGAALRRLREALPEGATDVRVSLDLDEDASYAGPWQVMVIGPHDTCRCCNEDRQKYWVFNGATIAEAADKCREALS